MQDTDLYPCTTDDNFTPTNRCLIYKGLRGHEMFRRVYHVENSAFLWDMGFSKSEVEKDGWKVFATGNSGGGFGYILMKEGRPTEWDHKDATKCTVRWFSHAPWMTGCQFEGEHPTRAKIVDDHWKNPIQVAKVSSGVDES